MSTIGDPLSLDQSTVSVIIPTYNSLELLKKCLATVKGQTLTAQRIECLVVDDGSTDDTWAFLQSQAADWPQLRIFHQANAGRPSVGRNRCIGEARGTYLYFLDSDDWLGTDALRRMLKAADDHGSDVVLGRGKGVGTKGVNKQTFSRTVYDADVINDHAWRILAPWKMFRTSLIRRLDLRFPEDQVQGEDQVFVATCYFNANKITILADYDYHYVHGRSSMENLSRQGQTLENKLLTTTRMTSLIVEHTEPGERRNALLRRIILRTLPPAFGSVFLRATAEEQEQFLAKVKAQVLVHLSDALLSQADDSVRLRLAAAKLGTAADVVAVTRALRRGLSVAVADGRLLADLTPHLNQLLGEHRLLRKPVVMSHRIEDVIRTDRRILVTVKVTLPRITPAVDHVRLVGRTRGHPETPSVIGRLDDHGRYVFDLGVHPGGEPDHEDHDQAPDVWSRWSRGSKSTTWKFRLEASAGGTLVGQNTFAWQPPRQAPTGRQHFDWVELVRDKPRHVTLFRSRKGQFGLRVGRAAARGSAVITTADWPEVSAAFPDDTPAQNGSLRLLDPEGGTVWEGPRFRTSEIDGRPTLINPDGLPAHLLTQKMIIELRTERMLCQEWVNRHAPTRQDSQRSTFTDRGSSLGARWRPLFKRLRRWKSGKRWGSGRQGS